jgi:4'-phosphopantetheinyl transferase
MENLLVIARYSDFDEQALSALCEKLPTERRERAHRAKDLAAKAGTILGYALLSYGVRSLLERDAMPILTYGEHGKPYLSDRSLSFSISHSKSAVAVLLAKPLPEIGVDLEEVREIRPSLIGRFASDAELAEIRSDRDAVLLWTKKEAVVKRLGVGLGGDLRKIKTEDTASMLLCFGGIPSVLSASPANALPADCKHRFLTSSDLLL